jgi:hypothetical protein
MWAYCACGMSNSRCCCGGGGGVRRVGHRMRGGRLGWVKGRQRARARCLLPPNATEAGSPPAPPPAAHVDVARLALQRERPQLLLLGLVHHRLGRVELGHLDVEPLLGRVGVLGRGWFEVLRRASARELGPTLPRARAPRAAPSAPARLPPLPPAARRTLISWGCRTSSTSALLGSDANAIWAREGRAEGGRLWARAKMEAPPGTARSQHATRRRRHRRSRAQTAGAFSLDQAG